MFSPSRKRVGRATGAAALKHEFVPCQPRETIGIYQGKQAWDCPAWSFLVDGLGVQDQDRGDAFFYLRQQRNSAAWRRPPGWIPGQGVVGRWRAGSCCWRRPRVCPDIENSAAVHTYDARRRAHAHTHVGKNVVYTTGNGLGQGRMTVTFGPSITHDHFRPSTRSSYYVRGYIWLHTSLVLTPPRSDRTLWDSRGSETRDEDWLLLLRTGRARNSEKRPNSKHGCGGEGLGERKRRKG